MSRLLLVTWIAKRGQEEQIAGLLRTMTEMTRKEPGCLRYEVLRSVHDPRHFVLIEAYADDQALQFHGETEHFQRYVVGQALPLLERRERSPYELIE